MSQQQPPTADIKNGITYDFIYLGVALLIAFMVRQHFAPVESKTYPGINGQISAPYQSPPPSMDELWHLALSTGRGDEYMTLPENQVLKDVPSYTDLKQARPWYTVWTSLKYVAHPPLFAQTLRIWRNVFGNSDMAAVWYSLTWSYIAIVLCYLIIRLKCEPEIACMAACVFGISQTQVYFAMEIRGYSMLVALILGLVYVTLLIEKFGANRYLCIALSTLLIGSMLTHYLALPVCLACCALSLFHAGKGQRWKIVVASVIPIMIFSLAWLPSMLEQRRNIATTDTSYLINDEGIVWLIKHVSALPFRIVCDTWNYDSPATFISGAIILTLIFIFGLRSQSSRSLAIITLIGILWVLVVDIITKQKLINFIRYCSPLVSLLVPCIFTVFGDRHLRRRLRISTLITIAFAVIIIMPNSSFPINYDAPALHRSMQFYSEFVKPDDTIVVAIGPDDKFEARWVVLELSHIPGLFPKDVVMIDHPINDEIRNQIRTQNIFLITETMSNYPLDYWVSKAKIVDNFRDKRHSFSALRLAVH